MSATVDIPSILKDFSPEQKESLLRALLRERYSEPDAVFPLSDLDLLAQAREVTLDGSTEYLRELQRRVETPDDSISFEEFMAQGPPLADR